MKYTTIVNKQPKQVKKVVLSGTLLEHCYIEEGEIDCASEQLKMLCCV